jgi:hypothetical protein
MVQYGWICPLCNRVYAPYMTTCPYCIATKTDTHSIYQIDFTTKEAIKNDHNTGGH